ncbi:MAG: hypothetical protein JWM80_148 [Cyanobacteria bacterium RYN_339]|nr:hypothetical protein [Cyanobacteria bacterium RYN_339]
MRIALILAAAAAFHPALTPFQPPGKRSVEFGCPLNEAGFAKLKKAIAWQSASARADYYFDGFDGKKYLLKGAPVTIKVRVKMKAKGPHWQVSRFVSKDHVTVEGVDVKIHVTESWEGKLKGAKGFLGAADTFYKRIDQGGAPLRAAGDQVDKAWRSVRAEKSLPGLNVFDHYMGKQPYKLYPIRLSSAKQRLTASLPGLKLMLGTEPERNAAGKTVVLHELEVEAENDLNPAQARAAAMQVGKLLRKAGVTAADQTEPEANGYLYTARQLTR